ncbi:hypothetical protein RB614_24250 [Phytohabitans sp. ZYX-F-186]|uniref:Uncharacterized protein n=1 Tax=Phytohabitans maris TaxID=3071409 RepID=A0ABU0ZKQ9_9ACTN|nr:hypothetical protein [Phytohabitans sp. ZYX-F-186]MDQ7907638.1 hypothetical protein [Phytohabitans sp. ZYX-F-186]
MAVDPAALHGDHQTLFAALAPDGTTTSNPTLQRRLGWDSDRYFRSRDALVDMGLVVRGRGRGGVVRRVLATTAVEERTVAVVVDAGADALTTAATVEAVIKNELALYEPMRRVIAHDWAKDHRRDPLAVEVTALQGRRVTGGTWSRPDIVSVEVRTFAYVPGKYLEVATFEVKAANAINVQAVYEALAHRRAATHSYVLLHVPADQADNLEDDVADVAEAARAHGIGVVTAADPQDYDTWEEREEARRVEPDPERLNAFVATQLNDTTRDLISRRLR